MRAIGYVRVSTDKQADHGVSLEAQEAKIRATRGLGISARQTEILLDSLHEGHDVEDAIRAAEIDRTTVGDGLLIQLARVIGTALGRVTPKK